MAHFLHVGPPEVVFLAFAHLLQSYPRLRHAFCFARTRAILFPRPASPACPSHFATLWHALRKSLSSKHLASRNPQQAGCFLLAIPQRCHAFCNVSCFLQRSAGVPQPLVFQAVTLFGPPVRGALSKPAPQKRHADCNAAPVGGNGFPRAYRGFPRRHNSLRRKHLAILPPRGGNGIPCLPPKGTTQDIVVCRTETTKYWIG